MVTRIVVWVGVLSILVVGTIQGIEVDTLDDELNGDGDCSLREAVEAANTNVMVDNCPAGSSTVTDVIHFNLGLSGRINLSLGQIEVSERLYIQSENAHSITLHAGTGSRIFSVTQTTLFFTIEGLVLEGGDAVGGGALHLNGFQTGTFNITNCVFRNNSSPINPGGAVYWYNCFDAGGAGTLTIEDCLFEGNSAVQGGALHCASSCDVPTHPSVFILDSIFKNNWATDEGGAISAGRNHLVLRRTAVVDNFATEHGGGIYTPSGFFDAVNTSIIGNSAGISGGGLYLPAIDGGSNLLNVTVYDNQAPSSGSGIAYNYVDTSPHSVRNSIVTGNLGADDCSCEVGVDWTSGGHNIFGVVTSCTSGVPTDLMGVDPLIETVGDWGGDTVVAMPSYLSPALDDIGNLICTDLDGTTLLTVDQRNIERPQNHTYPIPPVYACDIGAVERRMVGEQQFDIFADGFESGDTCEWSAATGGCP